ncbi:MAG: sigma-54 dependent transcriptional regulator [Planctomycetota bacterium]
MSRVLVIDDDKAICRSLQIQLGSRGHTVEVALTGQAGLEQARSSPPDIVFLDLRLPDTHGLEILQRLLSAIPNASVIMITGEQDMNATIEAVRFGAFDYIRKPLDLDEILGAIDKAGRRLVHFDESDLVPIAATTGAPREIVGKDRGIIDVLKQVARVSATSVTVLIEGESGTGKELVARAIHGASCPDEPFVAFNCSAVVPTLWESEIFGHEKGAFTGADRRKIGKLELAGKGSVFFDEIGDMSLELQAKLLRALQEREFERVGGTEMVPLRARVMAATHRDMEAMVAEKCFRADLMHRLTVARIRVPPLRERPGDIRLLVEHLLGRINAFLNRSIRAISRSALERLEAYDWPGNVRELENVLMRSVAQCDGDILEHIDCPRADLSSAEREPASAQVAGIKTLRDAEREHVLLALERMGWNITHTAKALAISPTTLRKKIADYGLGPTP